MLEMHSEKYVCLHVALLLLLRYDFNQNCNIKEKQKYNTIPLLWHTSGLTVAKYLNIPDYQMESILL